MVVQARNLNRGSFLPPKVLGRFLRAYSSFWWLLLFLGSWLHPSNLCLCLHTVFSPLSWISLCLSFMTLVIGFKAQLDNPGWSHLEILNAIISVKTFFQIRSHFHRSCHEDEDIGGCTIQPTPCVCTFSLSTFLCVSVCMYIHRHTSFDCASLYCALQILCCLSIEG